MEITEEQYARINDCLPVQRQYKSDQSAGAKRDWLYSRARLQVARAAEAVWPLAQDLYAHEPVGEKGRFRSRL
jgi:hypothetical protein